MGSVRKTIDICAAVVAFCLADLSITAQGAYAKDVDVLATLADRAAIHDLIVDYYGQIGTKNHDFSAFFAADGRLDVNGWVVVGHDEIKALYDAASGGAGEDMGGKSKPNQTPAGRFDMLFSNFKVAVTGETALATLNWYSVVSQKLTFPPAVTEYGRERTELVKRNGEWRIVSRTVISDGGMPESELKTYKPW